MNNKWESKIYTTIFCLSSGEKKRCRLFLNLSRLSHFFHTFIPFFPLTQKEPLSRSFIFPSLTHTALSLFLSFAHSRSLALSLPSSLYERFAVRRIILSSFGVFALSFCLPVAPSLCLSRKIEKRKREGAQRSEKDGGEGATMTKLTAPL
jgi:hypothetical protein